MDRSERCYSVLLVSASQKFTQDVLPLLPERSFSPVVKAADVSSARRCLLERSFDLLIINTPLPDEFGTEFALDCAVGTCGVLALCKSELYEQVAFRLEDSGVLTMPRPVNRQTFYIAIKLLVATHARLAKMEKQNHTLKEKMEDIRVVNRAKWLLIEHLSMTEQDAHYYIEKQAMDTRLSRREVAEHIIRTYDQ